MTDASEWTGPVGDVWARQWQRTDRSFADLSIYLDAAIVRLLPSGAGMMADIGCGAGATSLAAAKARPDIAVTGFDISPALIAIAATRAVDQPNVRFVAGPAQQLIGSSGSFDLIASRHGMMFFDDPVSGLSALHSAAKPGATLVFSCFRAARLNPWASEIAAAIHGASPQSPADGYSPGPFAFADEDFVRTTLIGAGWHLPTAQAVDFKYRAGQANNPVVDAVDFFSRIGPAAPALRSASETARAGMLDRIAAVCMRYVAGDAVDFPAAAWLWSAKA